MPQARVRGGGVDPGKRRLFEKEVDYVVGRVYGLGSTEQKSFTQGEMRWLDTEGRGRKDKGGPIRGGGSSISQAEGVAPPGGVRSNRIKTARGRRKRGGGGV